MSVELAKTYLTKMLTDPTLKKRLPVPLLVSMGRQVYGLTRSELKAARKELGVVSEGIDGVQFWPLPGDKL